MGYKLSQTILWIQDLISWVTRPMSFWTTFWVPCCRSKDAERKWWIRLIVDCLPSPQLWAQAEEVDQPEKGMDQQQNRTVDTSGDHIRAVWKCRLYHCAAPYPAWYEVELPVPAYHASHVRHHLHHLHHHLFLLPPDLVHLEGRDPSPHIPLAPPFHPDVTQWLHLVHRGCGCGEGVFCGLSAKKQTSLISNFDLHLARVDPDHSLEHPQVHGGVHLLLHNRWQRNKSSSASDSTPSRLTKCLK